MDPDAEVRAEVLPLLRVNRKMPAVRLYRQRTGADAIIAMRVIDAWLREVAEEAASTRTGATAK